MVKRRNDGLGDGMGDDGGLGEEEWRRAAADEETAEGLADAAEAVEAAEIEELRAKFRDQVNAGDQLTNLYGSADLNMMEGAIGLHEMFRSYVMAGFERGEALWIIAATMTGGPRLPSYIERRAREMDE